MGFRVRAPLVSACLLVLGCSSSSGGPVRGQKTNDAAVDGKLGRDSGHGADGSRVDARHTRDGARDDAHDAGIPGDSARADSRHRKHDARGDARDAGLDVDDARVDAPHARDGSSVDARDGAAHDVAPPPVFTLDAGTTWRSLYRDYFGPAGVASCAGPAASDCHGSTSQMGYQMSYFLCPFGDASSACYAGFTSGAAPLVEPDASFSDDTLSYDLCQLTPSEGTMPFGCTYYFTPVDMERIGDWVNAGAKDN